MAKKPRLGTDPFKEESGIKGLIRSTEEKAPAEEPSKPEGQSKPEELSKQEEPGKQSLQETKRGPGRPRTSTRVITKSSQEGTKEGWSRAAYILREEHIEKIKDVAYWDRKQIKEVMDEILTAYFQEKKVRHRPKT